jgi:hypothetical protein
VIVPEMWHIRILKSNSNPFFMNHHAI